MPQSNAEFYQKQQFETKFKPVINISVERFEDYYWEKKGNSASYFIKYAITESELKRIKDEFHQKLAQTELLSEKIRHRIDSLSSFQNDFSVESLVSRQNALSRLMMTDHLSERDSVYLINGLNNINNLLMSAEIRVLENTKPGLVRFGLYCGGILIKTATRPVIISDAIQADKLNCLNNIWELKFEAGSDVLENKGIEIVFDLPYKRLSINIPVKQAPTKSDFEIINPVRLSDFQKDNWNGKLKGMNIKIYLKMNSDKACMANSLEISLNANGNLLPKIVIEDLSGEFIPGINILEKSVKCDLPVRYFVSKELTGDISLYYTKDSSLEVIHLRNVPFTIN